MIDLELIAAKRCLGKLTAGELVVWAVEALSSGQDSDNLRRLAGLDLDGEARMSEAEPIFLAALREVGTSLPDDEAAIRAYVRFLAEEIVEGKVAPQAQVARIHAEVLSPLNHPRHLMVWCYVGDGMRPRGGWSLDPGAMVYWDEVPEAGRDRTIVELAKWYLEETRAA